MACWRLEILGEEKRLERDGKIAGVRISIYFPLIAFVQIMKIILFAM